MSLKDLKAALLQNSTSEHVSMLDQSTVYNDRDICTTPVPMLNVALSGTVGGGLSSGITTIAGPSKHFKTAFALVLAASYLKKHKDSVVLFYDSEFGSPVTYFESVGISGDRVVHTPITTLEELRHDITVQLKQTIKRGDRVVIVIDSLGNLASEKESRDAEEGNDKADLTRAKVGKSLFRIVTPHLRLKDIPLIAVQHTYETLEIHSTQKVSGGTGMYYSSDCIFIIGRRMNRETSGEKNVLGYDFIINVEKSRFVKEKSKIPITVSFKGGILKWSGLFDLALLSGHLVPITKTSYGEPGDQKGRARATIERDGDFWMKILKETAFADFLRETYILKAGKLINDETEDAQEPVLTEEAFEVADE